MTTHPLIENMTRVEHQYQEIELREAIDELRYALTYTIENPDDAPDTDEQERINNRIDDALAVIFP